MYKKQTPTVLFTQILYLLIFNVYPHHSSESDYLNFLSLRHPTHYAVRQSGMGYTGFSNPDDENVVRLNPAGLGMQNDRYKQISFTYSAVPKTAGATASDAFRSQEHYLAICSRPTQKNVGGFGFAFDLPVINYGDFIETKWGREIGQGVSTGKTKRMLQLTAAFSLAYAHDLPFIPVGSHALGFNGTVTHFYDYNYFGKTTSNLLSFDFGYNGNFNDRLYIGFVFSDIGFSIIEKDTLFQTVPRITTGVGINRLFSSLSNNRISLFIETNYIHHFNNVLSKAIFWRNEILNIGFEATLFHFFYLRSGVSYDFIEHDTIVPWGLGLNLFNRYELNFFHTAYATKEYDQKRFGFSISIFNLFE